MSIEAMKLALDALECVKTESFHPAKVFVHNPAITALRQAIAEAEQPARKPLTDEEINTLWDAHVVPVFGKQGINPVVFARAIERAHGIGEV